MVCRLHTVLDLPHMQLGTWPELFCKSVLQYVYEVGLKDERSSSAKQIYTIELKIIHLKLRIPNNSKQEAF